MKAYIIVLQDNEASVSAAENCIQSSIDVNNAFVIDKLNASTPDNVTEEFQQKRLKWNYPWQQPHLDMQSGLLKTPYETASPLKRMACFMSHYKLWRQCLDEDMPFLILEHDSYFIKPFVESDYIATRYSVISLNDPRGGTRKSLDYHNSISGKKVTSCPYIDSNRTIPQGLPGNSAYYIKPAGARKLIDLVSMYGAWPNDAIMCNQMMPGMLGCAGQYVTKLQKLTSTTTK